MAFKRPWVQVPYAPHLKNPHSAVNDDRFVRVFFLQQCDNSLFPGSFLCILTEALMVLKILKYDFAVCKVKDFSCINTDGEFLFIGKTDKELSVVCPTVYAPTDYLERDAGWRAFRVEGTLDFSLIGILSKISGLLAEQQIGIFAVSTFDTDYVLIKNVSFAKAMDVLEKAGYEIVS